MYEQSHRDYLRSATGIIVAIFVVRLLIITVITPLPTKPMRDKNARELKLANAAITDMRCVSVMLLRSMQNTRRS